MDKKYEIQVPKSNYIQIIFLTIMLITHVLFFNLRIENSSYIVQVGNWLVSLIILIVIVVQVISITRIGNEIEITDESIKTKNIELPIEEIEKIIIQGYFVRSIGIKRVGQRLVSTSLHFRFK